MPGRGEQVRLALHASGVAWEDNLVTGESWGKQKSDLIKKVPQANLPLLEVGGQYLTESLAILRYIGSLGNLIPECSFEQAKMDEGLNLSNDAWNLFIPTLKISGAAEQVSARRALVAPDGQLTKVLQKFDAVIGGFRGGYMAGNKLSVGDISWFCVFGLLSSGLLDGFDTNVLDQYANITTFRRFIGTNPKVASRYASVKEGVVFNGFKFE